MEIKGKKAVIVGGASGMAKASAELLAEKGASIAIVDLPTSAGAEVAKSLGGSFHPIDVTDFEGSEVVLGEAVEALGGLHISVNTAGGGAAQRTMTKEGPHDLDLFRRTIDLNLVSSFNISRLAAAHMTKNEPEDDERGVIINTASIAAFEGQIGQVAYTAAKAGIAGMTLTMAARPRKPRHPGAVDRAEPVQHRHHQGHPRRVRRRAHQGRRLPEADGPPEEYGKLAVAIVENPMLNGSCIRLDAGQRFAPK